MTREELLNKVRTECTPNLGWDDKYPELFGVYGYTFCGICDGWSWFEEDKITDYARSKGRKPLTEASDMELLEMLALANGYWLKKYEKWHKEALNKSHKLDIFIGECERKYFGYDEDGYTDKTIDRVLGKILDILKEKYSQ